jgi:hypothetical protein
MIVDEAYSLQSNDGQRVDSFPEDDGAAAQQQDMDMKSTVQHV